MFPRMVTVGLVYDYCVKDSRDVGAVFVAGRISFFSQGLEFRREWQGPVAYRRLQEHKNIQKHNSNKFRCQLCKPVGICGLCGDYL